MEMDANGNALIRKTIEQSQKNVGDTSDTRKKSLVVRGEIITIGKTSKNNPSTQQTHPKNPFKDEQKSNENRISAHISTHTLSNLDHIALLTTYSLHYGSFHVTCHMSNN